MAIRELSRLQHPCALARGGRAARGGAVRASGRLLALLLAVAASGATGTAAHAAETASGPLAALTAGTPTLDLRLRYEQVDDAPFDDPARAATLRTALGYRTAPWQGLTGYVEAEDVSVLGNALYADGAGGGRSDRPEVVDPEGTAIQQAYLAWEGSGTRVQAGRLELLLGDERYVGNVGWRQHHQSFDAVTVSTRRLPHVELFYGFVDAVHRVNRASDEIDGHLLRGAIDAGSAGTVALYGVLLDYRTPARRAFSTATWGAELIGERTVGARWRLLYELEGALQSDHGDNPAEVDADYTFARLGLGSSALTAAVGWERLGGAPGDGRFTTPLATLHKWDGWADKFLVTPPSGLEDAFLQLSGTAGRIGWTVVAHDFRAATGGATYGRELDLQLTTKLARGPVVGFKGARYDADGFSTDTTKLIVWTGLTR